MKCGFCGVATATTSGWQMSRLIVHKDLVAIPGFEPGFVP